MQTRTTSLRGTKQSLLSDSLIGKFLQKISFPLISEFLILASVFLFWYEGLFASIGLGYLVADPLPSVLLVLALVFADKSMIKITKSYIYLVLFLVVALFSGVLAASRGINPKLIVFGWLLLVQFLIAILAGQGAAKPKRLLQNMIFISLPMIMVGAYQFLTKQTTSALWITPAEASIGTRAFGFFGSPNVLGAVLAIVALVSASLFFSDLSKDSPSRRTVLINALMAAISVFAVVVTIFTFSRSAWIGLIAGVLLILFVRNWKLILFIPIASIILFSRQVRDRLATTFSPSYWLDSSLDGRFWAINNGLHIWSKYPLFGTGPGTYGGKLALNYASPVYLQGIQNGYVALYYTDNEWLQLLVQTGIIGLVLFALFSANVLVELIAKYNSDRNWTALGVAGAFAAFLVAGLFGNVLEFGAIAIPMGVMLGISFRGMTNEE